MPSAGRNGRRHDEDEPNGTGGRQYISVVGEVGIVRI